MTIFVGVAIRQRTEPSALCVLETEERTSAHGPEIHYVVRYLKRLAIGTTFPRVAHRAAEVASRVAGRTDSSPYFFLDVTGLGAPVVGAFISRVRNASLVAVYFTHGDRRQEIGQDEIQLGKAWLVAQLQTLLQEGFLHLPRTPEYKVLAKDLINFEVEVREDANERYGAFRVGPQDDLVTALGLACQPEPPGPGIFSMGF